MNQDYFKSQVLEPTFARLRSLTDSKGVEYRAGERDQLANFNRLATELGLPREKILMVYLTKHLDGIRNFVRTGDILSEPVEGRIDDAILYLLLLKAMVVEKKAPINNVGPHPADEILEGRYRIEGGPGGRRWEPGGFPAFLRPGSPMFVPHEDVPPILDR